MNYITHLENCTPGLDCLSNAVFFFELHKIFFLYSFHSNLPYLYIVDGFNMWRGFEFMAFISHLSVWLDIFVFCRS